mgnify:CR=1 FL=1
MRRATAHPPCTYLTVTDFYPRSPCGERLLFAADSGQKSVISIHALLAESDATTPGKVLAGWTFLSTLSLRRATGCSCAVRCRIGISIHALLAESDTPRMFCRCRVRHFYPRSPCGERPWHMETIKLPAKISIHALLAESDKMDGTDDITDTLFLSTLSLRRATCSGFNF